MTGRLKNRSGDVDTSTMAHTDLAPMERLADDRETSAAVTPAGDPADAGARLERTGRRWLMWSFILCPCHLPWTLAILAAVFGGSTIGVFVNQYRTAVGVAIAVIYLIGVAIGFNYLRQAKAKGACTVRF